MQVVARAGPMSRSFVDDLDAVMVGSSLRAIVLNRETVNVPSPGGIGSNANGYIDMIGAGETLGEDISAIERQHDMKPALCLGIESTAGIGDRGAELEGTLCTVNGRGIAIEAVD